MAPPTPSLPVALVMVLSLLLGIVNMVKQSGSVFGLKTVPSPWLPYFTLASTFLGGELGYFKGLDPMVLNGTTLFYATATGVAALLTSATPGLALHAHFVVPQLAVQAKKLARSAAATTLSILFVVVLWSCKAVDSVINEVDAECEQLSTQPDENGYVKLACEVLTATGDVIQFFEVKLPQDKAAAYLKAHPLKPGHKSPKSLAVTQ